MFEIVNGDVIEWANNYQGEKYHALLCDPPYHLGEQRWDYKGESIDPRTGRMRSNRRQVDKGFMGKTWDGGDVSFRPETWRVFYEHLYPGAFGMAFASTRGFHRQAVAIEDAGFILHPFIGWVFASGFPKATRIDTQIDRAAGAEREVVGHESDGSGRRNRRNFEQGYRPDVYSSGDLDTFPVTEPSTPLAKAWQEHRYGKQALKPAIEPILVFQKPYDGKPLDCITQTGAGALWIDGARIEYDGDVDPRTFGGEWRTDKAAKNVYEGGYAGENQTVSQLGRWPANLILQHAYGCTENECVDGCPITVLGEQSGNIKTNRIEKSVMCDEEANTWGGTFQRNRGERGYDDSGTAARFFFNSDYMLDRLEESAPFFYTPKASRAERDAGLEDYALKTIEEKDGRTFFKNSEYDFGWESGGTARTTLARNPHPTLKPLTLTKYLATLLLPPKEYTPRRLLVPFSGSGSEMIGGILAGWDFVTGIEKETEYCELAEQRVKWWSLNGHKLEKKSKPKNVKISNNGHKPIQKGLFDEE